MKYRTYRDWAMIVIGYAIGMLITSIMWGYALKYYGII